MLININVSNLNIPIAFTDKTPLYNGNGLGDLKKNQSIASVGAPIFSPGFTMDGLPVLRDFHSVKAEPLYSTQARAG